MPAPLLINFCPTGMVPRKQDNPHVPIHPQEVIEQVHEAYETGITIAHLHARAPDESPTWRPEIYQVIIESLRRLCPDLVLCVSTSGRVEGEFEKRAAVLELRPDMASLTLSSMNFINQASLNPPEMIQKLAEKMRAFGVRPELECFDTGMINYGKYLLEKGVLEGPSYWNLIFGGIASAQATPAQISACAREVPEGHWVALGGLGRHQTSVLALAVAFNLGVRVGLEDNLWFDSARSRPATNLDLLKRVHELRELHERPLLGPREFGQHGFYNTQRLPGI